MDDETREFLNQRSSPAAAAPRKHEVVYREGVVVFSERSDAARLELIAGCPQCHNLVNLDSAEHQISVDRETGKLTVSPSLDCPIEGCSFHVMLRDGVMTDC